MIPPELIAQAQNFIEEHKPMGYTTKEEFVRDAIRFRLTWLKGDNQCLEIPRDQFEKLNEALEEMGMPFHSAGQFINSQIKEIVEKYEEYKKSKKTITNRYILIQLLCKVLSEESIVNNMLTS